jgi:diadenosine tetraphosphate (Ap4A) HIT family hydrolase
MDDCWICDENDRQASGKCVGAVAGLATGWVRLHRVQRYRGAAFFAARDCVREVYHLDPETQVLHLAELVEVCAAIDAVFSPAKMNIESLGNGEPHLHWWLTPRHADDPRPTAPIWENLDFLRDMWTGKADQGAEELAADVELLGAELHKRGLDFA